MAPITNLFYTLSLLTAVASASSLDRRATYHDNDVAFQGGEQFSQYISSGVFEITEASVTRGQDPQNRNNNKIRQPLRDPNTGRQYFRFPVGRKASPEVASYWNSHFGKERNTFNDNTGELNFAIKGDLTLELRDYTSGNDLTIYVTNVALAQGRAGMVGNWWFGGTDCEVVHGKEQVVCPGINQADGESLRVKFQRGNKQINQVKVLSAVSARV